ncbi:MAG: GNAT family N-acetyltransferase [Pseudomonadota bacterium]
MTYHKAILDLPFIELRRARMADRQALEDMKELSISNLLDPMMTPEQRREVRLITQFDPALIEDGTYYVAMVNGGIAASGGWSRRATLYGANTGESSDVSILDPAHDAAFIRAMYTHPDFARKGLGSLILKTALTVARLAGFRRAQLLATVAGERLYRAAGWKSDERVMVGSGGKAVVPGYRMSRDL